MAKKSKKMQEALKKVDATKAYSVEEAVALAKDTNIAKFDATVEVAYKLNVDPKKSRPTNPWSSCASKRNW